LAKLPSHLTIVAQGGTSTASVKFALDSNSSYRTESSKPWAIGGDYSGNLVAWTVPTGSHTFKVTPYSKNGATGTVGSAKSITLNITRSATSSSSTSSGSTSSGSTSSGSTSSGSTSTGTTTTGISPRDTSASSPASPDPDKSEEGEEGVQVVGDGHRVDEHREVAAGPVVRAEHRRPAAVAGQPGGRVVPG